MVNMDGDDSAGESILSVSTPILDNSLPVSNMDAEEDTLNDTFPSGKVILDQSLPIQNMAGGEYSSGESMARTFKPLLDHSLEFEDSKVIPASCAGESTSPTSQTAEMITEHEKTIEVNAQKIEALRAKLVKAEVNKMAIITERDQALEDLRNVENAFSDVHRKYERAKGLLDSFRKNEEILKQRDQELSKAIHVQDDKIELLKEQAQNSLETMHRDYESKIHSSETENTKLRVLLRKTEMKISTLENDLEQKHKENTQLSALCDDLINGGVGNS